MTPDEGIVVAIERLMVESVAITTLALAAASPDVELTLPQWRALVVVGSSPDGLRVGALAQRIGSAIPAASRLIRRLERRGLVRAEREHDDRRATRVRLTDEGERVRVGLVEHRQALIRRSLASLAEPVPTDLRAGLARITDALADSA